MQASCDSSISASIATTLTINIKMDEVRRKKDIPPFNKPRYFSDDYRDESNLINDETCASSSRPSDDVMNTTFDSGYAGSCYDCDEMEDIIICDGRQEDGDILAPHQDDGSHVRDVDPDADPDPGQVEEDDILNRTFDSGFCESIHGIYDAPNTGPKLLDPDILNDPVGGESQETLQEDNTCFPAECSEGTPTATHRSFFAPRPKPKRKGWRKYFKNPSTQRGSYRTPKTSQEFDPVISQHSNQDTMSHSPLTERHLNTIPEVGEDCDDEVDVEVVTETPEEEETVSQPWDEFREETSFPDILHNFLLDRAKKKRCDVMTCDDSRNDTDTESSSSSCESQVSQSPEPPIMKDPHPRNPQDCSHFYDEHTRIMFIPKYIDCCCHEPEEVDCSVDEVHFTFDLEKSGVYFVENGGQINVSLGEHSYNKYMLREQIRRLKHGQLFDWGAVERGHSLNTGKYILLTIFIRSFSQSNAK